MSIKDNFSQAVKELWKKDGQDKGPGGQQGNPMTELDRYLRDDEEEQVSAKPAAADNGGSVPLETPYYRSPEQSAPQNAAPAGIPSAPGAPAAGGMSAQPTAPAQGGGYIPQQPTAPDYGMPQQNPMSQGYQPPQGGGYIPPQNAGYGAQQTSTPASQGGYNANIQNIRANSGQNNQGGYGGGYVPPAAGGGVPAQTTPETDEITVISKNTVIDGNVRSLANMQIDGNIKGNVETTKNIDMSGKIIGDITCNNAGLNSAAMQGNMSLKGRLRMDRDTILIGDLSSQYADINGRVRGKLDIVGKAELKRDAIVFGDINASTIAVTDGAIIQGYVNTTFLSKDDSRNVFPEAISLDSKEGQGQPKPE